MPRLELVSLRCSIGWPKPMLDLQRQETYAVPARDLAGARFAAQNRERRKPIGLTFRSGSTPGNFRVWRVSLADEVLAAALPTAKKFQSC